VKREIERIRKAERKGEREREERERDENEQILFGEDKIVDEIEENKMSSKRD
jgi:hypothetical protein